MPPSKKTLLFAKAVLLLPLALYLPFVFLEKQGYWDCMRGLDLAQQVAERFEKSVAVGQDGAVPVRAGDKEFEPTLALIRKYSSVKIPKGKTPQVIARYDAKIFDARPLGSTGAIAQWTSPATPIAVFYYDWPNIKFPNGTVPENQSSTVGTLGNLHEWIARSHEDFHFWSVDLLLVGVVPLAFGLYEFIVEIRSEG